MTFTSTPTSSMTFTSTPISSTLLATLTFFEEENPPLAQVWDNDDDAVFDGSP